MSSSNQYCHFFYTQGYCKKDQFCCLIHTKKTHINLNGSKCPNGKTCPIKDCNPALNYKVKSIEKTNQDNGFILVNKSTSSLSSRNSFSTNSSTAKQTTAQKPTTSGVNQNSKYFNQINMLVNNKDNTSQVSTSTSLENKPQKSNVKVKAENKKTENFPSLSDLNFK